LDCSRARGTACNKRRILLSNSCVKGGLHRCSPARRWALALIAAGSLAVLFDWTVSNPLLVAATAAIELIAFTILQPTWVLVK
jgi:hypothetical protein